MLLLMCINESVKFVFSVPSRLKMYECFFKKYSFLFVLCDAWVHYFIASAETCKLIIWSLGVLANHNSVVFFGQIVCLMLHSWLSFHGTGSRLTGLPLLAPDTDSTCHARIFPHINVITSNEDFQ